MFDSGSDLTYKSCSVVELANQHLSGTDWKTVFEFRDDALEKTSRILMEMAKNDTVIYPNISLIYEPFFRIELKDVRVIIVGQDPYHTTTRSGDPVSIGHAFASEGKVQPSLRNMYKKIEQEGFKLKAPFGSSLSGWTEQGVLLFNRAFTVEAGKAGSHHALWERVTNQIVKNIIRDSDRVVWLLMGRNACQLNKIIQQSDVHIAVESPHPSPLSQTLFFNHGSIFTRINQMLTLFGRDVIEWGNNEV